MSMSNQDLSRRTPRHSVPLSDAMNQLLRGAFTSPFGLAAATTLSAEMNLYETNDNYILLVPVPGVKPDQLSITVRENVVTIQGSTEIPAPEGARPIYMGTGPSQIREQIQLPGDVNADQAVATYDNGVLTLTLPKAPSARERAIPMRLGSTGQTFQGQQGQMGQGQMGQGQMGQGQMGQGQMGQGQQQQQQKWQDQTQSH